MLSLFRKNLILILFILGLIVFSSFSVLAQESENDKAKKVKINGEEINYIDEENKAIVSGEVEAILGKYHFRADEIEINLDKDSSSFLSVPNNILIEPGSFSGCDNDEQHYFFKAQKMEIKPNKYLKAYNVVFYELKGKLPLFYIPYMYIDLSDDRQTWEPEFGYSSTRGFYALLTYNYEIKNLPGQIYSGYYHKSGEIYGFKQYFLSTPYQNAYVKYLRQKNNTNLSTLAENDMELYYEYEKDNKYGDILLNNRNFLDYSHFNSEFSFQNNRDNENISINGEYNDYDYEIDYRDKIVTDFSTNYTKEFANDLSIDLEYDREEDKYSDLDRSDEREITYGLNLNKKFNKDIDINLNLERNLDFEGEDDFSDKKEGELNFDSSWKNYYYLKFNYEYGELKEREENLKTRESGKSTLGYKKNKLDVNTVLERYEPNFSDDSEDNLSYYRLPEFNLEYGPFYNFLYKLQFGNYYEDDTGTKGYRAGTEIEYNNEKKYDFLRIYAKETLTGRVYETHDSEVNSYDPYQAILKNEIGVENFISDNLTLDNKYNLQLYAGDSPFEFDQAEFEEFIENTLEYNINNKIDFEVKSGYDFYNQKYLDLTSSLEYIPLALWTLKASIEYDINDNEFKENLKINSDYNGEILSANTSFEYNLNNQQLSLLENTLKYEVDDEWGWYVENNISYDFEESSGERLEEANLTIRKSLHCRELSFSYDYLNEEFRIGYSLDLMPDKGVEVGKDENGEFLFKLGENEVK